MAGTNGLLDINNVTAPTSPFVPTLAHGDPGPALTGTGTLNKLDVGTWFSTVKTATAAVPP
uniref:hypothetical protein n=1 Tax=Pseudomonas bharatica TaxID=2692112 RepID=UPI001F036993|nr:hypothetical protein [Pseudomonas bharatica]